ncbi:beta-1,3-galactosyl-O-glycosyl-glycoprotein beta-1,6-N-acetylglucosaminyltransferase-like [Mercenaria mercenaria]|uniref:beta-1,3-galactosyl-O-glycosyl-glycoprotein beta-1,6-N-acetylglucosaminyltransferase-like n=1 Tax=Mercenaria mercenaria TaxID=6596 RepID=UPI001E1DAFCB|nr:beta-1,3-galactosyl-O-glycosyl-glycoprotein beta-1,6-N-acetylglucosaminyltransferase-like [Mercenaria mercenaria]
MSSEIGKEVLEKLHFVDQGHLRRNSSEDIQHDEYLNNKQLISSEIMHIVDEGYLNDNLSYHSNVLTEKVDTGKLRFRHYSKRFRRVPEVNCHALFKHDLREIRRADRIPLLTIKIERYQKMTSDCENFKVARGYITDYLTEEEKLFPLAYSILMYKDVEQTERLLRAIYRPQNIYCIHVDAKTSNKIFAAMSRIVNCFDNVFMPSKRIPVFWGEMTVLEPEILCMEELWKRSKTWKYFINLTGQEFPLKTNYELVKILKVYNGSNDVEATRKRNRDRWARAPSPPHGIIPTKGAVHVAVSRGFVDYVLNDKRAHDLLKWTKLTKIPDETFFPTLNHNPHLGVPGAYTGHPETTPMKDLRKPYLARFKNRGRFIYNWECKGMRVRGMCVFGHGDLARLAKRRELFANKFYLTYQPFVFGCLEEMIFNRTRQQYLGKRKFEAEWYKSLGFISNKVK